MSSSTVDSTTTGKGKRLGSDAVYSDEDASNSGEEVEQQDEDEMVVGNVINTSSCKRPFPYSQSDPDQSQAKKRRKQSKPVRLFSLTEPSDKDSDDEGEINCEGKTHTQLSPPARNDQIPKVNFSSDAVPALEQDSESQTLVTIVPTLDHEPSPQCLYCPEILNSKDRLKFHVENGHIQKLFQNQLQQKAGFDTSLSGKEEIPLNLSHLPTADSTSQIDFVVGSLMTEFRNKADESSQGTKLPLVLHQTEDTRNSGSFMDGKIPLPGYMPLSPHFLLPLMSQGAGHNQNQAQNQIPSSTPIRIFNPDAYCELCNKEFCNKYFLKTHKANKHGIYVESPTNNIPGTPYPFVQASVNLSHIPLPAGGPATPKPATIVPNLPDTVISSKISGNGQMKALCDICQKKFCNKYFVRRHKAKIHGIIDETLPSSGNLGLFNLSDCIRKQDLDEPESISAGSDTGSNILDTASGDISANISEMEEFRIGVYDKQTNSLQTKLSPTHSGLDESTECLNVNEEPEQELEEGRSTGECLESNSIASNKCSPTPSQQAFKDGIVPTEKLRKLGVINADAFCEICCKEYCNKYFLRTHKMKRHGIYISDCDGKYIKPGVSSNLSWNHNQTSPLNLIVGEQGTNSSDSGEKNRNDLSDSEDAECDLCGRRFQSFYLMQMHRVYLHMSGSEKKELGYSESNGLNEKSHERASSDGAHVNINRNRNDSTTELLYNNNEGNNNSGKDSISDDLQKLQTMISQLNNLNVSKLTTCTICNKESENHYCLRAHMMTEHGILVEDQNGVEGDKIPPLEICAIPPLTDIQTYCFPCKKDFISQFQLKQHIDDFHNSVVPSSATSTPSITNAIKDEYEGKSPSDKSQSQNTSHVASEKRVSLTPTNSYCEICNKELCNKYFMKTHMQRMHGIEIENGAQIGGVICDICNKELCSKYFLRVHKQNTHGIVEEGSSTSHTNRDNGIGPNVQNQVDADHALKPTELSDVSHRYFSHFTEVCSICSRRFRSTKWLKAHLLNDHGESGIDKLKELENHCQTFPQAKKHQLQALRSSGSMNNASTPALSYSPTLKIPNNWKNQDLENVCSRPSTVIPIERSNDVGGNQVFTNLFGSNDSAVKNYNCSYCNFTTPVLAFLFVHERSHAGVTTQPLPDPSKPFQCPVCMQSFLQAEVFQHHILTHQFSGMLSPFFGASTSGHHPQQITNMQERMKHVQQSASNGEDGENLRNENRKECEIIDEESVNSPEGRYKFRCSKCFQRFRSREMCLVHMQNRHNNTPETYSSCVETIAIKVTPHGMYKCTGCGFSSVHLAIVKKHIEKEHKAERFQSDTKEESEVVETLIELKEAVTDEVKRKLQEAARKSQVPASYAVPQNQTPCLDQFIMQPFLLKEPDGTPSSEQLQLDRKFVPSLVFLPVKEKLSEPLTVSFTLTPA
ncbi:hypothetical protein L9F63_024719 [Diploptera punctata]|uniref:C2H2-type domain-containing protein n=1 Tax=Diploptera punctata TaxID=6984 RepID=A0AAD8E6K3_DIPPU|nr:hypothetical protein L9F63_024719 [Diploptera punctata]